MKNFLIAALLVAGSGYAMAGHEVGNGGGVIYCEDNTPSVPPKPIKKSAELLDLYEARVLRNLKLSLGDPNEDYDLKIKRTLQKFARIAPLRAKKYSELYGNFFNETVIIPDADLVFIPDADNLVLPKGCQLKQVAIQKVPDFPGDNRYFISKEYWDLIDNNSKAALVLHEILYNEGIYLGHQDSRAVRYLNSYLTSDRLDTLTQNQFSYMLFMAKFQTADYLGTMVEIRFEDKDGNINFRSINYPDNTNHQLSFFSDLKLPSNVQFGPYTLGEIFDVSIYMKQPTYISGAVEINLPRLKFRGFNRVPFGIEFLSGAISKVTFMREGSWGEEVFFCKYDDADIDLQTIFTPSNGSSGSKNTVAELQFENDGLMNMKSYTGVIRVKNEKTGYQSPKLLSDGQGRISKGIVLSGILLENGEFQTVQGKFRFIATSIIDPDFGKIYFEFDDRGMLTTGVLAANQTVTTFHGEEVTTSRDMIVHFLENGRASLEELPSAASQPKP